MGAAVSRDTAPPASTKRILEGRLFVQVGRFGTPLAIGMGLQTTFNLVDAYILGRLEPGVASAALGAIGICDQLAALGTIVSYGLSVATATILSRRHGEGDSIFSWSQCSEPGGSCATSSARRDASRFSAPVISER
jgi:O-antigen/teichoic acid export membrane protein